MLGLSTDMFCYECGCQYSFAIQCFLFESFIVLSILSKTYFCSGGYTYNLAEFP